MVLKHGPPDAAHHWQFPLAVGRGLAQCVFHTLTGCCTSERSSLFVSIMDNSQEPTWLQSISASADASVAVVS